MFASGGVIINHSIILISIEHDKIGMTIWKLINAFNCLNVYVIVNELYNIVLSLFYNIILLPKSTK